MDEKSSLQGSCPLMVVTDLDGTLLDHDTYRYERVLTVLERLHELEVPMVVNTSKTRAEWLAMRGNFSNQEAFVIENGSAVIARDGSQVLLGEKREKILEVLEELKGDFVFTGFAELGCAGVARETGLDFESAKLASEREFSEPLIWQDDLSKQKEFCRVIEKLGLMTLEGGRFLHVLGATDKGRALEVLRKEYRPECVIALGDSQNDVAMLERADIGVVIASEKAVPLEVLHAKRLIWSKERGPNGWVEVMNDLLAELLETI